MSQETPSCADLAWQYPQAGERGARGREFESDPCSCLLLVKNEPRVCFYAGARVHALQPSTALPHSSQTIIGKKAIARDSATGWEGHAHSQSCLRAGGVEAPEAGAVLAESRGSCGGLAPVSPQPPA